MCLRRLSLNTYKKKMDDFRTYSKKAADSIDNLTEGLQKLDKMGAQARKKLIAEYEADLKRIQNDLDNCAIILTEMSSQGDKEQSNALLNDLREQFSRLRGNLEVHKQMRAPDEQAVQEERPDLAQMEAGQVIQRGYDAYDQAEMRLNRAYKTTVLTKEVAGNIEVALQEQEQQMDRVADEARGIKGLLKISNQLMNQIYRRYLTDKCILCLIIVIIIVIIFLIIYGALGLDSDDNFNTPDDEA